MRFESQKSNLVVWRPDKELYRYKMIHHKKEEANHNNPKRFQLLQNWKSRWKDDGLSVSTFEIYHQSGIGLPDTHWSLNP